MSSEPRSARRRRAPLWIALPALVAAAAVNVPVVYVFVRALDGGWRAYLSSTLSPDNLQRLAHTVLLVAGTVALSLGIALAWAWLVTRTELPARRFWAVAGALPLVVPSYVAAFSLVAVFGPRGFLRAGLAPLGVERLPDLAYGFTGALLALALFTYPYTYLLLVAALRGIDPAVEESARSLGAGPWRVFFRIVLPQLRPALAGGSLLVALYTVSDFGAVSIVRYETLTPAIYRAYGALLDRNVAAASSTLLVALALALVLAQAWVLRGSRPAAPALAAPAAPQRLGLWRGPALLLLGTVSLLSLGLPVAVVIGWGARGAAASAALARSAGYALNSLGVAALAALCAVALALSVALWAVRHASPLARLVERSSYSGHALPGLVIALALVFLATRHLLPLYQTLALLVAAYVVRFLPEALSASRAAVVAVAPAFEEVARSLGRGSAGVLRSVTLPLVRPGLAAGAGLVFLASMKELPATLVLRPAGFETLATRIWSATSEGLFSDAAAPALLLLLVSAVPVYRWIIRPALAPWC